MFFIQLSFWRVNKNIAVRQSPSQYAWHSMFQLKIPVSIPCMGRLSGLIVGQPLGLQGCIVTLLKDLVHICFESIAQVYGMTFKMSYVGSKYPYFAT